MYTPTLDAGVAVHYDVSMDPSLQDGIRGRATTIRAFDRDSILIHGYNRVFALSITVLLPNNKQWRSIAVGHGFPLPRRGSKCSQARPLLLRAPGCADGLLRIRARLRHELLRAAVLIVAAVQIPSESTENVWTSR